MNTTASSRELISDLTSIGRGYEAETGTRLPHVDNRMGAARYLRDAQLIRREVQPGQTVLDLGCGVGQMAYLLTRMGLSVVTSDIMPERPYFLGPLEESHGRRLEYVQANILDSSANPLAGRTFDAVCISGVLEHVPDFAAFLEGVRGLLVRDGRLFMFRFPNRWSWIEALNDRRFGNGVSHPLRFSIRELKFMCRWHGFRVDAAAYEEIFPVNLRFPGIPRSLIGAYHSMFSLLGLASSVLCRTPGVGALATSFRVVGTRARTKS